MHSILKHKILIKMKNEALPFVVWQRYQRFRRTRFSYTMNMQTEDSSGKFVTLYWTAGHHITKHYNFYKPRFRFQNVDNRESNIRVRTAATICLLKNYIFFLGNCPTWCKNSFQCIYLFIVLYMFRACHAHHQEKQIVSIQLPVIVTPCWWQCRVLVGSNYQKLYWYNLFLLMMSMTWSKHVENYK